MAMYEHLKYDGENDGIIMEMVNRHFNYDSRVRFEIPGVNCNEDFEGFNIIVPCFADGVLVVKHRVTINDCVSIGESTNCFPIVEVTHE